MAFFGWVPGLGGKYLNYGQYFLLAFGGTFLVSAVGLFILHLIWSLIRKKKPSVSDVSARDAARQLTSLLLESESSASYIEPKPVSYDKSRVSSFLSWLGCFALSLALLMLSTFDAVPWGVSAFLIFLVLGSRFTFSLYTRTPQAYGRDRRLALIGTHKLMRPLKNVAFAVTTIARHKRAWFFGGLAFIATISFLSTFFLSGLCFGIFNHLEGGLVMGPVALSTRFSRSRLPAPCASKGPCHLYITYPEHPSVSMFINVQMAPNSPAVTVYFDTVSRANQPVSAYAKNTRAEVTPVPLIEAHGARDVHSALLTGLLPATSYFFVVAYEGGVTQEKKFRTAPNDLSAYTFITGGDVGTGEIVGAINKQAARQNPLFGLVGGDVAYDNGMHTCYRTWDAWIGQWEETMVDSQQHVIPMVLAVGNHDSGTNSQSKHNVDLKNSPPLFFSLFPQHSYPSSQPSITNPSTPGLDLSLPEISQRRSYHTHYIGNYSMVLSLDSGHVVDFGGDQAQWIEGEMGRAAQASMPVKMAVYHVPLYPGLKEYEDHYASVLGQKAWVPIFDQHHLTVGFENHVHLYKKTPPLKNGSPDPSGTVYVGDGLWGVDPNPGHIGDITFGSEPMEVQKVHHIWRVDVSPFNVTLTAFNKDGTVLDTIVRPVVV
eukprot:GILI01004797.1.p1 GENE.GILI01004797.1~~GILI01004797.1.p1  ORF type:complete len:678 (+),score=143.56 GILI01004797.1:67-2034(+)